MRSFGGGALAVVLVLAVAMPAAAQDPAPASPAWLTRELTNFLDSQQRGIDRALQGALNPIDGDPPRALARWAPARGQAIERRFDNRYGASIAVTLFRPNAAKARPLPTVVIIPGYGSGVRRAYYFLAEDLAEHGYLALVFDPQNQGDSAKQGRPETCVAGGSWQQPQELGLREAGSCAGRPPDATTDQGSTPSLASHAVLGTDADHTATAETYRKVAPAFVLGTFDAAKWLLSAANPWRAWVDPARVGLAGHSAGAYGAAEAANGDPLRRFKAAVALDGYQPVDHGVAPRVPTLWVQSEQELAPRIAPPRHPRTLHPTWASFDAFRAAGVPAGLLVLRSSTHLDFTDGAGLASRYGARYSSYLTLAWFDRFLRGDRGGTQRLFAERFDRSVDVSSIGTGGVDAAGRNIPPVIAGERVADSLSFYYPGAIAAFGADCRDPRVVPCAVPAARLRARVLRRRGRRLAVGVSLLRGDSAPVTVRLVRGGKIIGRAGRRIDLGYGANERRVGLRLPRTRVKGRATLVIGAGGRSTRVAVRLR